MPRCTPDNSFLIAAIGSGVAGTAMFNLAPLFLAAAADRFMLDDTQIGQLISVEIAGIALASFAGLFLIPKYGCRRIASLGLAVVVIGNMLAVRVPDHSSLLVLRFFIGFCGDGMAYVAAITALGQLHNPTRGFALLSFSNMCFAGSSLALLPQVSGGTDWAIITLLIAVVALAGLFLIRGLPETIGCAHDIAPVRILINPVNVLALVGILAFTINLGAVWGYAERIGSAAGLSIEQVGFYLGISMAFQGLGSLTAAGLSTRVDRRLLLVAVLLLQLVALYSLASVTSGPAFVVAVSLWGFSWNIGIANLLGIIAGMSNGKGILTLAPGTEAIGASLGPAIAATMIVPGVYTPVMLLGVIAVILSISLFIMVATFQHRREKAGR